jgi:YbgC/YbaW family acyl-CoA thioester hydrolase
MVRRSRIEHHRDPNGPPQATLMTAFQTTRRVEFCHTDAGGIMHFAGYFEMMEQAEHEMLRDAGLSVVMRRAGRTLSWPRVSATCDFSKPAHFEDELDIRIGVAKIGKRSVTYAANFFVDGTQIASGELVAVCCVIERGEPLQAIDIPPDVVEKLQNYSTTC